MWIYHVVRRTALKFRSEARGREEDFLLANQWARCGPTQLWLLSWTSSAVELIALALATCTLLQFCPKHSKILQTVLRMD
jgi:hypothetical protein